MHRNIVDGFKLKPTMTDKELTLLQRQLGESRHYLEYGAGYSTIHACQSTAQTLTSVDSDRQFLTALRTVQTVAENLDSGRLRLLHGDVGPVSSWGIPKSMRSVRGEAPTGVATLEQWHQYIKAPFSDPHPYDLVLVDGIFRAACVAYAALHLDPCPVILVHDFLGPKNRWRGVQRLEQLFHIEESADSMVKLAPLEQRHTGGGMLEVFVPRINERWRRRLEAFMQVTENDVK